MANPHGNTWRGDFTVEKSSQQIQRRVRGSHDIRMDGVLDLLMRAKNCSVFDMACNRGMIAYEFAQNGATTVHGCDIYDTGVSVAKEIFADIRNVESHFEVVDLTGGAQAIVDAFKGDYKQYDIMLFFGIYHKLVRIMPLDKLHDLVTDCAKRTTKYFCWRGGANETQVIDGLLKKVGDFKQVQYSEISELGPVGIWSL